MTVEELEATTADQPRTAEQAAIILLQCMSPLMALSGHTESICYLSAFGQQRTNLSVCEAGNLSLRASLLAAAASTLEVTLQVRRATAVRPW